MDDEQAWPREHRFDLQQMLRELAAESVPRSSAASAVPTAPASGTVPVPGPVAESGGDG